MEAEAPCPEIQLYKHICLPRAGREHERAGEVTTEGGALMELGAVVSHWDPA